MSKPTKYIFVTGGVVSSLGKGLAAASLGTLLEHRGLSVILQKFDPYLNVDPGTMSPFQHGEVYVLDDGAETDLDLGHYERFTNCTLTKFNNLTSGQVFENVIRNERKGVYLGKTVQFIPHCTDEIKNRINEVTLRSDADVIITEIGGTVGDIEGHLFIEALRQFSLDVGRENVCFLHVTLLPLIKAAGEIKTKPTQQSVAKLREMGIQPDIIVCRTEHDLDEANKKKIAMFCNVKSQNVVAFRDVDHTIYECPLNLREDKLDRLVTDHLGLESNTPDLQEWTDFVDSIINPTHEVKIGVIGKYIELQDAYKSIYESLTHAGAAHNTRVTIVKLEAETIEKDGAEAHLKGLNGVLIPGGFGDRGTEGKILTAQYARENKVPLFGICLGMQIATIEFARNACGLTDANSTEFNKETAHPVISLQEEQQGVEEMGATMRLGASKAKISPNTRAAELYGQDIISERHRHRYEFNPAYREQIESAGLTISAVSDPEGLVEIVEITDHPFYIGAQFHPEFQSKPNKPHPIFSGFVAAALKQEPTITL
ncbi:CTP synthase [Akkermansiaceae bacterium]|nr:CTP synthase [Akkermansiaceae bacterium]